MGIRYLLTADGKSPFARWFDRLDAPAAAKVTTAITRLGLGNLSSAKSVGQGVMEYRIDWGPGYRLYFGREGDVVLLLLLGGTKQRQSRDIATAQALWAHRKDGA